MRAQSQKPALREGDHASAADDDMVEHANVEKGKSLGEFQRDGSVGLGWLGDPRGMVMREDDGGRVEVQRFLGDFARMHGRTVDRTAEEFAVLDQPVTCIEKHRTEHFVIEGAELCEQKVARDVGRADQRPAADAARKGGAGRNDNLLACCRTPSIFVIANRQAAR